jgi:hypothetical protein
VSRLLPVIGLFVLAGVCVDADVSVVALGEPADPVRIVSSRIDVSDPAVTTIFIELENTTTQPLNTNQVWLNTSRFFTKAEALASQDRIIFTCGQSASGAAWQPVQVIPPAGRVSTRISIRPGCEIDPQHSHFYVYVSRLTAGARFSATIWEREPPEFVRMLTAAMHN